MRNTILTVIVASTVAACAQMEPIFNTEYVWTPNSSITIDGEDYVIRSRAKSSGGEEVFIVVDGKNYKCEGTEISEENCRKALERGLSAAKEDTGDDY